MSLGAKTPSEGTLLPPGARNRPAGMGVDRVQRSNNPFLLMFSVVFAPNFPMFKPAAVDPATQAVRSHSRSGLSIHFGIHL